ncbi:helix-hairpin-helix domain-containing protein [Pectinatus haikarae]|uniref:Competence protein ComEA n=1 Tax=Pectinatus haikarae TaxID=349096 RepID=A0ABT9Y9W2_9FIRM|nr:helix-hairpin-helix domain-containing protein [Pectinatus haikarae]MDQ0203894.1 competence protein ComEA [Pectinatus haikarae]
MPMFKKQFLVLLLIGAAAVSAVIYGSYFRQSIDLEAVQPAEPAAGDKPAAAQQGKIVIYVTGAVNNPGVIELPDDARVIDAINKCGGMNEAADPENINLSMKIADGTQIKVPAKNSSVLAPAPAPAGSDSQSGKININYADESTLDKLPGVGPSMAKRIAEYRQSEGLFQSLDDLKKVRGIGEAKFNALKDKITL